MADLTPLTLFVVIPFCMAMGAIFVAACVVSIKERLRNRDNK